MFSWKAGHISADPDGDVGTPDGKAGNVEIIGDKAYFTYDSFGVVYYAMNDLIAEVPGGG